MPAIMKENVKYAYTDKGIKAHTLSYAEYQALSTEEKMNGDLYFIPDKQPEGNPSLIWDKLGTATLDTDADNVSDAVNELNSNLTDLFLIRQYSYEYTVASYTGITITKTNLGITPISGYTIGAINFYATGSNPIIPRTINYAGNDIVRLYNPTNNSISSKFTIGILWIKSDFVA